MLRKHHVCRRYDACTAIVVIGIAGYLCTKFIESDFACRFLLALATPQLRETPHGVHHLCSCRVNNRDGEQLYYRMWLFRLHHICLRTHGSCVQAWAEWTRKMPATTPVLQLSARLHPPSNMNCSEGRQDTPDLRNRTRIRPACVRSRIRLRRESKRRT